MIRILVVEDDASISMLLKLSLEKAGYSCACAANGEIAAELLREPFDL